MTRRALALALALGLTVTPGVALAAGDGHGDFSKVEVFFIINFVVLVFLLWKFAVPRLNDFLGRRHSQIKADLEEAGRLKREADATLAEYKRLMGGLDQEIATIREQFRADGERERARILAEAEETALRMRAAAEKQIKQEAAKLREQLEREVVTEVLAATEALARAQMNAATQREMFGEYIAGLEGLDQLDQFAA